VLLENGGLHHPTLTDDPTNDLPGPANLAVLRMTDITLPLQR
jgi:hypothetical protein